MTDAKKKPIRTAVREIEREFLAFQKAVRKDGRQLVTGLRRIARESHLGEGRIARAAESCIRLVEATTTRIGSGVERSANRFKALVIVALRIRNKGTPAKRTRGRTARPRKRAKRTP